MDKNDIPREIHVIININCSDAREGGPLYGYAKHLMKTEYAERGILVDYIRISSAGSFITPNILEDVKMTIEQKMYHYSMAYGDRLYFGQTTSGEHREDAIPIRFFINISSHGDVRKKDGVSGPTFSSEEITINQNSPFNCGMLKASEVWLELADLVLKEKPVFTYFSHSKKQPVALKISSKAAFEELLLELYGYTGILEDFIKSIDRLDAHVMRQKYLLRNFIETDNSLKNLMIHLVAAVNNYPEYSYLRVDGNTHINSFLDDVYGAIGNVRTMLSPDCPHILKKGEKQQPLLGVIHAPMVERAKEIAVMDAILRGFIAQDVTYTSGQVFTISGKKVTRHYTVFEPYQLIGFFYSILHLKIDGYVLIGDKPGEERLIKQKMLFDPLMHFVLERFNVKLMLHSTHEIRKEIANSAYPLEKDVREIIESGIRSFKPPSTSVLQREKISKIALNGTKI